MWTGPQIYETSVEVGAYQQVTDDVHQMNHRERRGKGKGRRSNRASSCIRNDTSCLNITNKRQQSVCRSIFFTVIYRRAPTNWFEYLWIRAKPPIDMQGSRQVVAVSRTAACKEKNLRTTGSFSSTSNSAVTPHDFQSDWIT